MNHPLFLALVLAALSVLGAEPPSERRMRSSVQIESVKRRGNLSQPMRPAQRGRKKSIWSYNPGHRSLAFLIAGEVEEASPPPVDGESGVEYRCFGCCRDKTSVTGRTSAAPKLSNKVGQIDFGTEGFVDLGTEPNSINDRCLGCCLKSVTPSLRVTPETEAAATARTGGEETAPTMGRQWPWRAQRERAHSAPCTSPACNPHWRGRSSSSSEEIAVIRPYRPRRRLSGHLCRRRGCTSALGSDRGSSSSSSSEED